MGDTHTMRVGRRGVEIHRPEKVLFPSSDDGGKEYTKGDLVAYYRAVAPFMLPHLRGRPLMLERHPDGLDGPMFMQKNTPEYYPDWIERVEVPKEGGTVVHPVCANAATLVYLAGQACLTPHRWLSKVGRLDRPDRMVLDLDPAEDDFAQVRQAAGDARELLDELKLPAAPMTTGSKGLHIVVPLTGRDDFDVVRDFAREIAEELVRAHPERLTTAARKKDRGDRLYLDVQRNAYAQTAVAPFAVRARPGAPVATPLTWEQLDDPAVDARRWTLEDAVEQARTRPWAGLMSRARALGPARRRLAELTDVI
ncbi:ATP-dependent DNA ligase [Streptomyces ipomoeae]|jgi:bifunctional non-homologous end joining protein LigD|uniref:DNA polymerase LigD, polymerase domain protein n=2 Tax=Streptomyces ipomoeae TaxID=103232 RepID=L1L1D0_9ACTN|nr:non-homologous end-joining DNA ligase [Streptomyces ipomoeae]EKX66418.1 DNA polymerase LigD, polymerase domain protein [Streptomyces ipomoeae 91-03]MDX2694500.1 non-homologous end-joining DNA ligase [Streptomyces ipomoeae]MDX2823320.1 non-homologous end-joining DNA ligase [Streptomyces ipomoeae]MDX2842612.1 non-homologous end-joining DNA ligase [Streptomyces ipomoeae]MDX2874744.1 non-homologous end-joining DNA ligase [Streptomyces ipomoeae]